MNEGVIWLGSQEVVGGRQVTVVEVGVNWRTQECGSGMLLVIVL